MEEGMTTATLHMNLDDEGYLIEPGEWTEDAAQERSLSSAVMAQHRHDLAARNREVDPVDDDLLAVPGNQTLHSEERAHLKYLSTSSGSRMSCAGSPAARALPSSR